MKQYYLNILFFSFLGLILTSCSVYQTEKIAIKADNNIELTNTYIKTKRFEGVIFDQNKSVFGLDNNRFTPTINDIKKAENILHNQIADLNEQGLNQIDDCPKIHKKLDKYRRQYLVLIDKNGDKIIYINCFWIQRGLDDFMTRRFLSGQTIQDERWTKEFVSILDGCSYFWSIKVNLTRMELFDLRINGIA